MARYADIVSAVKEAVGDASDAQAQRWVLQASRLMNSEAKWNSQSVDLGVTTAGTSTYTLGTNIIDLEAVLVDGVPYEPISPSQYDLFAANRSYSNGRYYTTEWSSSGAVSLKLFPIPDESGLAITSRQVVTLTVPTWASDDPVFPPDFDYSIENMAIAIGKARLDEELVDAQWFEDRFADDINRLKARKRWRLSKGPVQIGVKGYHF